MDDVFRVGISADFLTTAAGHLEPVLGEFFDPLPFVTWGYFHHKEDLVAPDEIADLDGVITLHPRFDASSFACLQRLAVIARWGVGYDYINVPDCTAADVLLSITTDAVRKPVAEAIVTFFLALAKRLPAKDRLVRTGRWDLKPHTSGLGMVGKTVGSVGMGNIGSEMFRLLAPFDLGRRLAYDPYISSDQGAELGVELVDLATLFRASDFVAINCPLTDETRGMINAELLALIKPTAYLINTARGGIINQKDLTQVLQAGRIGGAGLDVFEEEPLAADHPLTGMDNVILSPHGMAWTDDLYRGNGVGACENVLTVLRGHVPKYTVNRDVLGRPGFQVKLGALRKKWQRLSRET
jgi:phosphoglycerate dehydrogenase-like enzyme